MLATELTRPDLPFHQFIHSLLVLINKRFNQISTTGTHPPYHRAVWLNLYCILLSDGKTKHTSLISQCDRQCVKSFLSISQLLYSPTHDSPQWAMKQHLSAAILPELQPAHSCGPLVSVPAGRGMPSGPDAEPEPTSAGMSYLFLCEAHVFSFILKSNLK